MVKDTPSEKNRKYFRQSVLIVYITSSLLGFPVTMAESLHTIVYGDVLQFLGQNV